MALFDPKQIDLLEQGYQRSKVLKQQLPQPQPTRGRGGTLTSLISEGGAVGGGLGGAALGTAILPGIGTLVGGALGAGAGALAGRLTENQVRDSRFGLGDALKEAGVSTVLGGGP